jgi:hypothetical protein
MRRLSSKATFFYKWVFPTFWFGFLLLFMTPSLVTGLNSGAFPPVPFLIIPVFMAIVGYFLMKKLVFDLVDEVWDGGNELVIRNRHLEEHIALSEIMNVNCSQFVNPPRVTLSLRTPCMFGSRVSFLPPLRILSFSTSPLVDELIKRIDDAKRKAR